MWQRNMAFKTPADVEVPYASLDQMLLVMVSKSPIIELIVGPRVAHETYFPITEYRFIICEG